MSNTQHLFICSLTFVYHSWQFLVLFLSPIFLVFNSVKSNNFFFKQTYYPSQMSIRAGYVVTCAPVVYNCFFAESHQAKSHRRDVILHADWKNRTWVIVGSSPKWGVVPCWLKERVERIGPGKLRWTLKSFFLTFGRTNWPFRLV